MAFTQNLMHWIGLSDKPAWAFVFGIAILILAGELVVLVLRQLEQRQFGTIHLGALFTPLCTGFPNLMVGLFGQDRLSGDLILQMNIGNNIANTTLVTGTIIFLAGPLMVRPLKGKSKKARRSTWDLYLLLTFFWLGACLTAWLAADGSIDQRDGIFLVLGYVAYQLVMWRRRGTPSAKKRLGWRLGAALILVLALAALLIAVSVESIGLGLEGGGRWIPQSYLGLLIGLLMVIPESFLLLRLAFKQGSLGLAGLAGDGLVSIPLVVGVSACLRPIHTAPLTGWADPAAVPFFHLALGMAVFSILAMKTKPVPRWQGLFFMALYAMFWVHI